MATTVEELSLDDQISKSQAIVVARAESVQSAREVTDRGRPIVTTVRFSTLQALKGGMPGSFELRFLGGKIDDLEMKVDGMPQFTAGAGYLLFVSGESGRACPLVGWAGGGWPVEQGMVAIPGRFAADLGLEAGDGQDFASVPLQAAEQAIRARVVEP